MAQGYQFVHLEAYSRKPDKGGRSVSWVLDEAAREPGASPHVPTPAPPEVVHGVDLAEVRRLHDDACASAKVVLANGKERAVRRDQKSLLTVIASHPATMDQVRADSAVAADVRAWEQRTVDWLRNQYDEGLVSVVRHTDESHPHLHVYVLPADLRAARLHPGAEAKRLIVAAGPAQGEDPKALNRRGDAAYKQAMRDWQDSYHQHVGVPCGLARLGPGRRRLSRDEWQAERAAAIATKTALARAAKIDAQGRAFVAKTKLVAAAAVATAQEKADAAERQAAAATALQAAAEAKERKALAAMDRAGRQAKRIVAAAQRKESRISSWGGRIRAFIDGLRRSSVVETARRVAAAAVEYERVRADEAARRVLEETARRQEAERRAQAAVDSARTTARERDQARQELAALRPVAPAAGVAMGMRR